MATKKLPVKFKESLQEKLLEVLWRQWRTLGIAAHGQETIQLIDLEALILATAVVSEQDSRLWAGVIQWFICFQEWVNQSRLKRIAQLFTKTDILLKHPLIKKEKWEEIWLFFNPSFSTRNTITNDQRSKRLIALPRLAKPSLLQLYLRGVFGVNARAELILYLLVNGEGNSNQIARETHYDQKNIYIILERWVEAGFVSRVTEGKQNLYTLERRKDFLLDIRITSSFWSWSHFFQLYARLLSATNMKPWATDPYLLSSIFRDIHPQAKKIAKATRIIFPEPELFPGEDFLTPMARALLDLLDIFQ